METQDSEVRAEQAGDRELRAIGFVVLFSADEPEQIGAWLPVMTGAARAPRLFGRGPARADDEHPRLAAVKQRPHGGEPLPPFVSESLSRAQLLVEPRDPERLALKNLGRRRVLVNGVAGDRHEVRPGDVLEIGSRLVLLCAVRSARLDGPPPEVGHSFGLPDAHGLVGESPAMWSLRGALSFVGGRPGHVLVLGASGAGKELVARALHTISGRTGPFVARSAATIPEALVDAELFGNLKGYPNPGMAERKGLVGAAEGGSLFLDEFGDLPVEAQAHLLRVLDAGEYHRLGEATARRSDFRLIGATNRPESTLRPDVLARFDFRLRVPDLGERVEDLPLLARHLLETMTKDDAALRTRFFADGPWPKLDAAFVRRLARHRFATNVRELRNLLWRSVQQSQGDRLEWPAGEPEPGSAVPGTPTTGERITELRQELLESERKRIIEALDRCRGNQTQAAVMLGMSRRTLVSRLRDFGLQRLPRA